VNNEFDVLVVGSGAAGLTAAVVAAQLGLKVLVIEKSQYYGGTTAYSLGAPWIIANMHQKGIGINDDISLGERYLKSTLGDLYDAEKVSAYLQGGAEMVSYMEANTEVHWAGVPMPDYFPDADGASFGRTLFTRPFDGSVLGPYLTQVRPPLSAFSVFGGMQIDMFEAGELTAALKRPSAFWYSAKKTLRYAKDRMVHGRGAFMANGNALVGRLLRSALTAKVELWRNAQATGLVKEGGAVVGAKILRDGSEITVRARKGVVLASGGFGANAELRAKYIPFAKSHISLQPESNVGDGIRIGQEAGGALGKINPENGVWAPISVMKNSDGTVSNYPHFGPDRAKPGSIIVDTQGHRFANESAPYQTFVHAMHARGITSAYFIANRRFARAYGMGFAFPAPYPIGSLIRKGYLIEAPELADLAKKLSIDPVAFVRTVREFNDHAKQGKDPAFGRGSNVYDKFLGDPANAPNPSLAPLEHGPFYAIKIQPGDVSTVLGLETAADSQVRAPDGAVIPGLYAVGLDQNTVMRGVYPGGGSGIGPGMTFGYRAARHMAGR
jgi:succinate dehydrogenase/fumarate reductase flavoprotein subunit